MNLEITNYKNQQTTRFGNRKLTTYIVGGVQNILFFIIIIIYSVMSSKDFYMRYYVGHRGKFGHEFLEFEFRPDGNLYFLSLLLCYNNVLSLCDIFIQLSVCLYL